MSMDDALEIVIAAESLMLLSRDFNGWKIRSNVSSCSRKKVTFVVRSKNSTHHEKVLEKALLQSKKKGKSGTSTECKFLASNVSDELETFKLPPKKRLRAPALKNEEDDDENDATNKVTNLKKDSKADQGPVPPPDMPQNVKSIIDETGGTGILLIIQKRLTATDVSNTQNRLQIPFSQIPNNTFLTNHEKQHLISKDEKNGCSYIETPLLDPSLESHIIKLRQWLMSKSDVYALTSPWIQITKSNGLRAGDAVQLWAYRVCGKLHLALIKL